MFKVFILGLVFLFLFSQKALAVSEFSENHQTSYTIDELGIADVLHKIEVKNKVSNIFAEKYILSLGFTNISEIQVIANNERINPTVSQTQNQTTISFNFSKRIVLKGNVNTILITYRTSDVVTKNGSVWEINIPRLEIQNDLDGNEVVLKVPNNFGVSAFIIPPPSEKTIDGYVFKMNLLGNKSISAVFGQNQYLKFSLKYFLENINPVSSEMEITLPPDTNYQKVWLESIEPKPSRIDSDGDGNWLAIYHLKSNEKKKIKVEGRVSLSFSPELSPESESSLAKYMVSTDIWNTDALKIKELAANLKTAKPIYQYVVDHLVYDYGKISNTNTRVSADILANTQNGAICTDYSDLLISILRAAKIPAREIQGYAFTSNDKLRPVSLNRDVLHSWTEYYNKSKSSWIYVDPTWEDTTGGIDYFSKIDLNHFAFVIHGMKSFLPLPAGAYKDSKNIGKDINVVATEAINFPEPIIKFEVKGKTIYVQNLGQVSAKGEVLVTSQPTGIIDYKFYLETLPPLGKREIELNTPKSLINKQIKILIKYDNKQDEFQTTIPKNSIWSSKMAWIGGLILFFGATTIITGRLLFRRR